MKATVAISLLVFLVGCTSQKISETNAPPFNPNLPSYPPIEDANSSVRAKRSFQVPTQLNVKRTDKLITMSVDINSLETIELDVGYKMVFGVKNEQYAVWEGKRLRLGSGLSSSDTYGKSYLMQKPDGIQPGEKYAVEVTLIVFETDIPAQHFWMPESGKYKELWRRTLRADGP